MSTTQSKVKEVTSRKEFNDIVLNNDKLHDKKYIFVDFYAKWCGPCMRIAPDLDNMCNKYGNTIYFIKIDIDKEDVKSLVDEYEIMSLPTFMIFNTGSLESKYEPIIGADKNQIEKRVTNLVTTKIVNDDF